MTNDATKRLPHRFANPSTNNLLQYQLLLLLFAASVVKPTNVREHHRTPVQGFVHKPPCEK
jgi:hypothetical protein